MASTPTVTIKIKGVTDAAAPTEDDLYMMYMQAVKGDARQQWIVFPPAVDTFGDIPADKLGQGKYLARKQDFPGNRSKWFHYTVPAGDSAVLLSKIETLRTDGWAVTAPILVRLEAEDYLTTWRGDTSHKAMRAVDRALAPYKLSVK